METSVGLIYQRRVGEDVVRLALIHYLETGALPKTQEGDL